MEKTITTLRAQKNNSQRVNVFLDGEFAFSLSRLVAAWLRTGQKIDDEKIDSMLTEDAREKAYQLSLNYLSYRDRSTKEIQEFLSKHQVDQDTIQATISRLKENNLLDDARFSEIWVDNRSTFHPRSKRAMTFELKKRGISEEQINLAIKNVNEDELAYNLGKKRASRFINLEWPEFQRKMYSYLSSRGFSYDQIKTVVLQCWKESQEESNKSTTSEVVK